MSTEAKRCLWMCRYHGIRELNQIFNRVLDTLGVSICDDVSFQAFVALDDMLLFRTLVENDVSDLPVKHYIWAERIRSINSFAKSGN